jgi:hypothetical protein
MADVENLHFKIGLSGTYWGKKPSYSILLNDQIITSGEITGESDEVLFVEFDSELAEGDCTLKIRLENKTNADTVQNEDRTEIVKDMLLNIVSIEIDEIELGNLLYSLSEYTGDDPSRPVLKNCVNLGWNGTWCLPFTSPVYLWLLENI